MIACLGPSEDHNGALSNGPFSESDENVIIRAFPPAGYTESRITIGSKCIHCCSLKIKLSLADSPNSDLSHSPPTSEHSSLFEQILDDVAVDQRIEVSDLQRPDEGTAVLKQDQVLCRYFPSLNWHY